MFLLCTSRSNSHLYRSLPVLIFPFTPVISMHHLYWHCLSYFPHRPPPFFFFFTFPCKFSLLSFTRRGLLPTRVPPPTPLSIHYPFIVLDFITTLDFSSVYICMETPDSFGRMPPTAARFMTFSFSSHFACAHGCMRITSRFTVHTTVCARRPGRLCRAKLPSRQVGVYAHETWIRRVWWWNCYLLIPWSVTLMSPSQYIL